MLSGGRHSEVVDQQDQAYIFNKLLRLAKTFGTLAIYPWRGNKVAGQSLVNLYAM